MRTNGRGAISVVLFGQTRGAVLALLYGHSDESFYVRQISRNIGISPGAVQRELEQLALAGLIARSQVGNQVFYRANTDSPIFPEIRSLVAKTVGLSDTLRLALEPIVKDIRVAFVFGSVARQEENAKSDIDLMIVGDVTFDRVISCLGQAQEKVGRQINPTTYSAREFRAKLNSGNHFLRSVLQGSKLFLIGTEDDLRKLGAKRVA
jgi:predicted nucleotidyltransferase